MILNKASYERGFAHATVYKSEVKSINTIATYISLTCMRIIIILCAYTGYRPTGY